MKNIFKFLFVFIVALFSLDYIDLSDTNESGYKENLKYDINENLKNTKENNPILNLEENFKEDKIDGQIIYKYKNHPTDGKSYYTTGLIVPSTDPDWIVENLKFGIKENGDFVLENIYTNIEGASKNIFSRVFNSRKNTKISTITYKPTDPEYKYIIENNPKIASAIKYVKGETDISLKIN